MPSFLDTSSTLSTPTRLRTSRWRIRLYPDRSHRPTLHRPITNSLAEKTTRTASLTGVEPDAHLERRRPGKVRRRPDHRRRSSSRAARTSADTLEQCVASKTGRSDRRAVGWTDGAICVQRLDDSLNSAIHTTYRSSRRSSSMHEPRGPPLEVFLVLIRASRTTPQ